MKNAELVQQLLTDDGEGRSGKKHTGDNKTRIDKELKPVGTNGRDREVNGGVRWSGPRTPTYVAADPMSESGGGRRIEK